MAGLVKAKKYDWKDSNVSAIGTEADRKLKKGSAETEPAWKDAGKKVGLQIWRIVQFKVTQWPKDDYGKFFSGDSYIVLNTYKKPDTDELLYDIHFWIGQHSTQDEYGTAAYKTVELDTLLDDKPIEHREVMGYESDLFRSYFSSMTTMDGGAETGFKHVKPHEYKPRLLHLHGDKYGVKIMENPMNKHCLDSSDVFILDMGLKLYQWNGESSNKDEKYKAAECVKAIVHERNGKASVEVLDEFNASKTHVFYTSLSERPLDEEEPIHVKHDTSTFTPCIFKVSDETGKLALSPVQKGTLSRRSLNEKDVFLVDTGKHLFVWIGSAASSEEKKKAMMYAHNYLKDTDHPLVPVSCIKSGNETEAFQSVMK